MYVHEVEPPLLKDTPNKGHSAFNLSIRSLFPTGP